MSEAEAAAFMREHYWEGTLALRRIDELTKDPNGPVPQFGEIAPEILQTAVA
jgi:predicted HD phosphohydrolase